MNNLSFKNNNFLPKFFYNIKADLPSLPKPPLHPMTKEPLNPKDLEVIFPKEFVENEITMERFVKIPEEILEVYSTFRPTPLIYTKNLKKYLDTPAEIFYKYEGASPTGSHKTNTAIMQAYYAKRDGIATLTTETGAGQWGSALSYAGYLFGLNVKVFMVRISYRQKPGRKTLMNLFNAEVVESPSDLTEVGKRFLSKEENHTGSLGIAISEAIEITFKNKNVKYSLGSVLDCVLMHQTIIGLEAEKQMEDIGLEPDMVIGCVGGGSNFAGISFPFIRKNLKEGKNIEFLAVEPEACPSITKGELKYDYGDTAGLTPLIYMYTLGKDFLPPPIHAGGLRYHGMAPLVSHLVSLNIVKARAYSQEKVLEAGKLFYKTEGILPAPESSHAIAAVIDEALKLKKENKKKTILFNLSGHGFLDMAFYEKN